MFWLTVKVTWIGTVNNWDWRWVDVDCLIVDQATTLSVEPRDVTVSSVGDVVVFRCQLHGIPTPHTHWYRGSDVIAAAADDDDERYVVHDDNGLSILEIHTVTDDDAGYFHCRAGNDVERSVVSRFARLSFNATTSANNRCK